MCNVFMRLSTPNRSVWMQYRIGMNGNILMENDAGSQGEGAYIYRDAKIGRFAKYVL